jgi:hypothetical protein
MKKGLRGILIAVAAVFGLLMVFNGAEIAAKLTGAPNASESILLAGAPGSAAATLVASMPTVDASSGKGRELLFKLQRRDIRSIKAVGGVFFQDGTYIAVDDDGGDYKQITVDKEGSCFLFLASSQFRIFYRSETILLKPGMVAFFGVPEWDLIFSSYRAHTMEGVPIIFPVVGFTIDSNGNRYPNFGTITARTETADINFVFTGKAGQDKIPKIPVSGAKDLWYTSSDGKKKTLTDAFGNPMLVKVEVPYSLVEYGENNKWLITPPVRQQEEVKLTQGDIDELLSLEP